MKFGRRMPSPTSVRFFPKQFDMHHARFAEPWIHFGLLSTINPTLRLTAWFPPSSVLGFVHSYCYKHIPHVHKQFNMHHATLLEPWINLGLLSTINPRFFSPPDFHHGPSSVLGFVHLIPPFPIIYNWWRITQTHVVDLGGTRNVWKLSWRNW